MAAGIIDHETGTRDIRQAALVIGMLGFVSTAALAKFLLRGEAIESQDVLRARADHGHHAGHRADAHRLDAPLHRARCQARGKAARAQR
jgi:hypothetical protein